MSLISLLKSAQTGFLKNVLTGAGVSLATGSIAYLSFQQAVNAVKNQTMGLGGDFIAILHVSGFDAFMSIILAAIATRLTLNSSKLFLVKGGGR